MTIHKCTGLCPRIAHFRVEHASHPEKRQDEADGENDREQTSDKYHRLKGKRHGHKKRHHHQRHVNATVASAATKTPINAARIVRCGGSCATSRLSTFNHSLVTQRIGFGNVREGWKADIERSADVR